MQYRNRRNWKPVPYTPEERAENEQWAHEQSERDAELDAEVEAIRAALHPAFAGIAAALTRRQNDEIGIGAPIDIPVTNEECIAFALEQIARIGKRVPEALKPEVRAIYRDVRDRGGDAYAEHKARLQQLAK